jgi:hypothetical protein
LGTIVKTRYLKVVVVVGVSGGVMIFPLKRKQAGRQAGRHMINPNRPNIIPQNKVYQSPFTKQTWRNVKRPIPSPQELRKKKVAAQRLSIKPIS